MQRRNAKSERGKHERLKSRYQDYFLIHDTLSDRTCSIKCLDSAEMISVQHRYFWRQFQNHYPSRLPVRWVTSFFWEGVIGEGLWEGPGGGNGACLVPFPPSQLKLVLKTF